MLGRREKQILNIIYSKNQEEPANSVMYLFNSHSEQEGEAEEEKEEEERGIYYEERK